MTAWPAGTRPAGMPAEMLPGMTLCGRRWPKNGWRDLTGNLRVSYLIFSQDANDRVGRTRGYQFRSDESEITFAAEATADSGMKYGFTVELQSQTNDGDNADETWMFIDGGDSWGRIEMGDQDGAADRMFVGGEDSMPGRGGYDGAVGDVYKFAGARNRFTDAAGVAQEIETYRRTQFSGPGFDTTGDATKIIYFSPRFGGLQLGASYTPDTGQNGASGINDRGRDGEDVVSLGANYQMSTNDVGVTVGAGVEFGDVERSDAHASEYNYNRWGFGAKLAFAGFEISSGYVTESDVQGLRYVDAEGEDQVALKGDAWWANIGLRYTTGPWKVGGGYFYSETEHNDVRTLLRSARERDLDFPGVDYDGPVDDTEIKIFSIGANYNVAPGFDIATDINFVDEDTFDITPDNPDDDADSDGTVFVLSTIMSF